MGERIMKSFAELPVTSPRCLGRSVPRVEDPLLLTGRVEFIDNVSLSGMLHGAILRSPHAHARIRGIDVSAAEALEGVAAVVTGADARRWTEKTVSLPEGWGVYCLAVDKVRFVGEPVAAVAATSRYLAEDALELIQVEYEPLPPVVEARQAMESSSPLIFEEHGTNVMYKRRFTWGEVDAAFRRADYVFSEKFRFHRAGANPLETFGVISQWDPVDNSVTCRGSYQAPAFTAMGRVVSLRVPSNKLNLISHPHGGSFGGKGGGRGTDITAMLSRKAGGRPVKWIEDRMEYLAAGGSQAWDRHYEVSIAVTKDGIVTGLDVTLLDDLGATGEHVGAISAVRPLAAFTGCYAIPAARYDLTMVATNKLPASSYRGMGVPPQTCVLEQMLDIAARALRLDPAEIRRRNFIRPEQFPFTIPSGNEYDSGDYAAALDKALALAGYERLRGEQTEARAAGRLVGIGIATTVEPGVFDWNIYSLVGVPAARVPEGVTVSIDLFGKIGVRVGFNLEGQGQFTIAAQVLADYFGVGMDDVRVIPQDTLSAPPHFGPGGNHLGVALTAAILGAAERLREKLTTVASRLMEAPPESLELRDGNIHVRGMPEAAMSVAQVAAVMLTRGDLLPPGIDPRPEATYVWVAPGRTSLDDQGRAKSYLTAANACHVAMVEVDRDTGQVSILKYVLVDDCGTRLNPANVEGMIDGGFAQGIGMALLEEYAYDRQGQLLTSTFMDYLLPSIHEIPPTEKGELATPSPFTPFGAKGVGEAAIHATPTAVLSAINDALEPLGAGVREMPATPRRLWRLIAPFTPPPRRSS